MVLGGAGIFVGCFILLLVERFRFLEALAVVSVALYVFFGCLSFCMCVLMVEADLHSRVRLIYFVC